MNVSETTNTNMAEAIELYSAAEEVKETETKTVAAKSEISPESVNKIADAVIAKLNAPKAAAPKLHLKKISKKEIDKKDHALAKKHITKNAKNLQLDATRGIVVLEKSGKTRAYKIGNGSGPALAESSSRTAVLNHIKNIKA